MAVVKVLKRKGLTSRKSWYMRFSTIITITPTTTVILIIPIIATNIITIIIIIIFHIITINMVAKTSTLIITAIITTIITIIIITHSNIIFIDTTVLTRRRFTVIPINIPYISITIYTSNTNPFISITVYTSNTFKSIIKTWNITIVTNEAVSTTPLCPISSSCTCR